MSAPSLELLGIRHCPFAARAAIALSKKGVTFKHSVVEPASLPLGLPMLKVGGQDAIHGATPICEYAEDALGGQALHPDDKLERAKERAWVEVAGRVLNLQAKVEAGGEPDLYFDTLRLLEDEIPGPTTFRARGFSLVDAAFAPVFARHARNDKLKNHPSHTRLAHIRIWAKALLEDPVVAKVLGA